MKPSRFLPEALAEMIEAARYYEARVPGLGETFLAIIEEAVAEIREHPGRWPLIRKKVHRRVVTRFPYAVLYQEDPDEIIVKAVMHLHRDPKYWIRRA